ncbi:MAG: methylmalonyl-CoA epimerase [Atribacterota bacterium]|nr:methylmalonyl-CoA epimerase [Atribacterota bacterium]MDD4896328.1 methylmalonyl-CoA epimerase [Atribacterota bacterium]MDD5638131.1 methylmalonyl-CoA epimerase [Atribacterota bacterium]
MLFKKINHIGIAVKKLEDSLPIFQDILDMKCATIEEVADQKVKVACLPIGESEIELLESTSSEGSIARFIEKRGEGIHHIAFEVDNLKSVLEDLKKKGVQLIDQEPRHGAGGIRIAFLHPRSTNGILIELCEHED